MFKEEFKGLPRETEMALKNQLEELIRKINQNQSLYRRDKKNQATPFTNGEISVMIYNIFDLAARLKNTSPDNISQQ